MKAGKEETDKRMIFKKMDFCTFYVDDKSDMGNLKLKNNRLPVSVVRRLIGHPATRFFKTEEEDVYIVRRIKDPEAEKKKEIIWEHTDKVLEVFPEVKKELENAQAKIGQPGCSDCGKNAAKRALIKRMAEVYREDKDKERDVMSLEYIFNQMEMATILGEVLVQPVKGNIMKGPRPSCTDCARKHLAQAIVLLGEAHLGYPEHRWLAIGHLAEASEETIADYKEVAEDIRTERLKLMANSNYKPLLMELIERITDIEDRNNT
jgi:hypothetical protein